MNKNRKHKNRKFRINKTNKIMRQRHREKYHHIKGIKREKNGPKRYIPNKVIKLLDVKKFYYKIEKNENSVIIEIPTIFSLITNPEKSIQTLKKIFTAIQNEKVQELFLDYSKCEELGLCASSATDIIILNGIKYRRIINKPLNTKGNVPKSQEAREIFIISGLVKHLGISKIENKNTVRLDIIKNEEQGKMTDEIIQYYDKCLKTQNYQLTAQGKSKFAHMIGEVLDNVNQHAGELATWYASGHFNIDKDRKDGKCRLVLFDFGDSIYEGLNREDTTEYTKKLLRDKTKEHYNIFNKKWNEEPLWMLYVLQYNVSRKRVDVEDDRGKGTIKLINNFMHIGKNMEGNNPIMAILSGNGYILFDSTYTLKEEMVNGKRIPIIAFNEENDLSKKPDSRYVKRIDENFPGTMISMEFYLDKEYIEKQMEASL